jgi:DNA-binding transcriptional LysR family regulator
VQRHSAGAHPRIQKLEEELGALLFRRERHLTI